MPTSLRSKVLGVGALALAIACGGSSSGGSNDGDGASPADRTTITTYQQLADEVQSAARSYAATMSGPGMTLAGCPAAHEAYEAQVRDRVGQMGQMSGAMDDFMGAHQGPAQADLTCVVDAMQAELDAYGPLACTAGSLDAVQAAAVRHADAMSAFAAHAHDRSQEMMGGLDGHGYHWSSSPPQCGGPAGEPGSDPVALGQRLFERGIGVDGQPVQRAGGFGMMASSGCATCHGSDGHGFRAMMFVTPNITYANLTDPAGMVEPDGGRGPTYTDDQLRRAIVEGLDAEGDGLDPAMPRWQLTDEDWDALLAYLKTLP